jgi:hypothetical protein
MVNPTWYPEGWEVFKNNLGPGILPYLDQGMLFSRVGKEADPGGGYEGWDSGTYAMDPTGTKLIKVSSQNDFIPGYYGNVSDPLGDWEKAQTQVPEQDASNSLAFVGMLPDPNYNRLTGGSNSTIINSLLGQTIASQRYPEQQGLNKIAGQWMPGLTTAVISAISGGAGAAALGGAIGATAGGAVGGGVAGGMMAAPKTMQGEGLMPLAAGVVGGALTGASLGPGIAGDYGAASGVGNLASRTEGGALIHGSPEYTKALAELGMTEGDIALRSGTGSMMTALRDTGSQDYWSNLGEQTYKSGKDYLMEMALKKGPGLLAQSFMGSMKPYPDAMNPASIPNYGQIPTTPQSQFNATPQTGMMDSNVEFSKPGVMDTKPMNPLETTDYSLKKTKEEEDKKKLEETLAAQLKPAYLSDYTYWNRLA